MLCIESRKRQTGQAGILEPEMGSTEPPFAAYSFSGAAAWLALACASIAYAFWWDITRGLGGNLCDLAHGGLRQDLLLLPHWARRGALYYVAVGFNFVARCSVLVAAVAAHVEWRDSHSCTAVVANGDQFET